MRNSVFLAASSRLAIDLARQSSEAAAKNLEIVSDNYTLGLVSLVDLLDAQTNALNAELAAADAVNNYLVDLMRVERAVGRFTFFVSEEERGAWITELEEFAAQRYLRDIRFTLYGGGTSEILKLLIAREMTT